MTVKTRMEFDGLKELGKLLKDLPPNVERRVLQKATNKAMDAALPIFIHAAPIERDDERSENSKKYGSLRSNIKRATGKTKRKTARSSVIHTGDSFWGYILEVGTRFGVRKEWFLPAFKRANELLLSVLKNEIGAGITKEAMKLRKK